MKKFVAALAVVPLVFSLAACGSSSNGNGNNKKVTIGVVGTEKANDVLKEEAAKIEATLKALPNGKYTCGDATLTVSHPRRFNEKKFVETYSPEAFPQFYQTIRKVDLKTLAPALKDQFAEDSTARLTIR